MKAQGDLFPPAETIPSQLCAYRQHCGARAALGPAEDRGGCVNLSSANRPETHDCKIYTSR